MVVKINLSYTCRYFYYTIYHGYWKYKVKKIYFIQTQNFFTSCGGYLAKHDTLNFWPMSAFQKKV